MSSDELAKVFDAAFQFNVGDLVRLVAAARDSPPLRVVSRAMYEGPRNRSILLRYEVRGADGLTRFFVERELVAASS